MCVGTDLVADDPIVKHVIQDSTHSYAEFERAVRNVMLVLWMGETWPAFSAHAYFYQARDGLFTRRATSVK